MWSDNITEIDLLGFEFLSKAARRLILDQALHPTTVGIFGLWGSGKSSLAGMLRQSLAKEEGVLCLEFNAWTYEGFEDAKSALLGTILEQLLEEKKLPAKSKDLFLKLLRSVDLRHLAKLAAKVGGPMAAVAAASPDPSVAGPMMLAAGVTAAATITVDDVADTLKPADDTAISARKGMREFRKDFERLLKEAKLSTLVVFIDDLDRCLPDTVVEVLEAIRLFLSTPKTVFVVCADERLVRSAVRRRFPAQPGDDFDVANEYLEKLVQHPIRIHTLGQLDVRQYLALLLIQGQIAGTFPAALEKISRSELEVMSTRQLVEKLLPAGGAAAEDIVALVSQVADVLGAHLNGNPRQLKRFLNTLMVRMGMADDRKLKLNRRVLAKLMVLEYAKLSFFRQLSHWQAAQAGFPAQITAMEAHLRGAAPVAKAAKKPKESTEAAKPVVESSDDPGVALWTNDPWLREWLTSEPTLTDQDLRPYFLLARDRLDSVMTGEESLTPAAAAVLALLVAPSKLARANGPREAKSLTPTEASSVLRALSDRCRRAQSISGEGSALEAIVELVKVRDELSAEAMMLFEELSANVLGIGAPPLMAGLAQEVPAIKPAVDRLLQKWGQQQANPKLAEAVRLTQSRKS
jgi:hypothetical protein